MTPVHFSRSFTSAPDWGKPYTVDFSLTRPILGALAWDRWLV
jgi:hypothetical protein